MWSSCPVRRRLLPIIVVPVAILPAIPVMPAFVAFAVTVAVPLAAFADIRVRSCFLVHFVGGRHRRLFLSGFSDNSGGSTLFHSCRCRSSSGAC